MASSISFVLILIASLLGCTSVLAAPCTIDQVMECVSGMENLDPDNMSTVCPIVTSMTSCLTNLKDKCDASAFKSILDQSAQQIATLNAVCGDGSGPAGDVSCSMPKMQKCMSMAQSVDPSDLESLCAKQAEAVACMKGLLTNCPIPEIKSGIESSLKDMENVEACGDGGSAPGCSLMDKMKCMKPLETMKDGQPSPQLCQITKDVVSCLEALKSNCASNSEMVKQIDADIKTMTSHTTEECCEALVKIKSECEDVEDILVKPQETKCMKLETLFNCIQDRSSKCDTGPMKKGIDDGMSKISKQLDSCKNTGYEVEVEYEKHIKTEEKSGSMGGETTSTPEGANKSNNIGDQSSKKGDNGSATMKQSIMVLMSAFLFVLFTFSF